MTSPPKRIWLSVLHLFALGILGTVVLTALCSFFLTAMATVPVLGVGLVLLIGLVYVVFATAWVEVERVAGLYCVDIPSLSLRKQSAPGFASYLKTLGRQAVDGRMWRAIGNLTIGTVLGLGAIVWSRGAIDTTTILANLFGVENAPLVTAVGMLLGVAGVIGLAMLFRTISIAIISAGAREAALREQREGAVRAADVERTRIERDLHDGVQPRLVSVAMTLGLAAQTIDEDPAAAKTLITEAHTSTKAAITELRQLARGIYASVLDDRGLDAALSALAARSHIPVHLDVRVDDRCSRDAEAAVYFAIAESLTNAAKHSRSSESRVTVRQRDSHLWARVEDNGIGGARVVAGGGLDGIRNRVIAAGGTITLVSPTGGPTSLEVSVPCAS